MRPERTGVKEIAPKRRDRAGQGRVPFAPGSVAGAARHLLIDACAIGRQRDGLTDRTLRAYEAKLDRRLDKLRALTPTAPSGAHCGRSS